MLITHDSLAYIMLIYCTCHAYNKYNVIRCIIIIIRMANYIPLKIYEFLYQAYKGIKNKIPYTM